MIRIRSLSPEADRSALRGLLDRATDYALLETGQPPSEATVDDFFTDAPPGGNPAAGLKLGLFTGQRLDLVADLAFGWPEPDDAYLGLMLCATDQRGRGLGTRFLDHVVAQSRARGAVRLLLAVLEGNPRARAFWERHGFTEILRGPPREIGRRRHVLIRMARPL